MNILNTYVLDLGPDRSMHEHPLLMAVLTQGEVEDFAVYEGIVPSGMPRDLAAVAVAERGTKCHYPRALTYFPYIPEDQYRR